jgi:hypothetical protein
MSDGRMIDGILEEHGSATLEQTPTLPAMRLTRPPP